MIRTIHTSATCLGLLLAALVSADTSAPRPPQLLLGEVFSAVQEAQVFPDGKTFADALPKQAPAEILRDYRRERPQGEALRAFVLKHFTTPATVEPHASPPERVPLLEHIDGLWNTLTRESEKPQAYSSLLPLAKPFVVPGGRFREMYYWDSYFTMLGLAATRRDLLEDMVANFADLLDRYGHIPNGTRSYYLTRSQPPFFYAMVGLLNPDEPGVAYERFLPQLKREYAYWMQGAQGLPAGQARRRVVALPDGSILNRYWDDSDLPRDESYREDVALARRTQREPRTLNRDVRAAAESGWDFGSRWFEDARSRETIITTEIIPVDLNSLLFGLERAIASGCRLHADTACTREFDGRAARRRAAVDHFLWTKQGGYADYRFSRRQRIDRVSAAIFYPLFTGMASDDQAAQVAETGRRDLLRFGGIVTTPLETGQQWDAPNGWAPLQWVAIAGLRSYGQQSLANGIACRWLLNVDAVYRQTGKLVEKYDVVHSGREGGGGEYPNQDGFGWTNGVTRRLMELYPEVLKGDTPTHCL